jgi:hypothetical protein
MSGLKENDMSNGEVLAAVNKNNSTQKIQNPINFPPGFLATTMVLLNTFYIQG